MSYYSDDDDVFDVSQPSPSFSSSDPITSSSPLDKYNIPSYLKDALSRYIQDNPELASAFYSHGREIPAYTQNFANLSETLSAAFLQNQASSSVRAAIDILDEMTDGAVSRRSRVYDFERAIQAMHINLWVCNDLYAHLTAVDRQPTAGYIQFIDYLLTYIDIAKFSIADLAEQYSTACEYASITPSQDLVESGMIQYADSAYISLVGYPTYTHHFLYGDTSNLIDVGNLFIEDMCKAFAQVVFSGDELEKTSVDEVSLSEH